MANKQNDRNNDVVYQAAMQILEPIVVGLLQGTKKLVIESIGHNDTQGVHITHTIKVVDTEG